MIALQFDKACKYSLLIYHVYLSGSNLSGSGQYSGLLWRIDIGTTTSAPLGIVTPLIFVVAKHLRDTLFESVCIGKSQSHRYQKLATHK